MVLLQDVINIEVEQDTRTGRAKKKKKSRAEKGSRRGGAGEGGELFKKDNRDRRLHRGSTRRWRKSSDEMASEKDKKASD